MARLSNKEMEILIYICPLLFIFILKSDSISD